MTLTGSSYDRGVQHGRAFAQLIQERTGRGPEGLDSVAPVIADERLERMVATLKRIDPDALDELHGIADGARLPARDILLLNLGTEIAHETSAWYGCSTIAFAGTPHGTLIGKNDDGDPSSRYVAVQRTTPDQGYAMLRVVYVGEISSCGGVNAAGLAYVGASIMTRDSNWDGFSLCALTRYLLARCATVNDAVHAACRLPVINHSANVMLADASGQGVVVERLPHAVGIRRLEGDALYSTNDARCPETAPFCSATPEFAMNSAARFERLASVLAHVPRTLDGLASVLKGHDAPGAICQHGQAGMYTTISMICSPADHAIHVTDSCPCQTSYQRYAL